MTKELPSPELLRKLLRYDVNTGKLYWHERTPDMFSDNMKAASHSCKVWNRRFAHREAFTSRNTHGYLHGRIFGSAYQAHRVVWAMCNGNWPEAHIDHINGIRDDNRISNLRCASITDNNKNMRISVRNNSGHVGVRLHKPTGKWVAEIGHNGKSVHLGYFSNKSDAITARKEAEIRYGFHANHGQSKSPALGRADA